MQPPNSLSRDEQRRMLQEQMKVLNREEFRAAIRKVKDNHLLGDLRYDFNWDPDPRKSTWQAIEINRLLTDRKAQREALPQWIAIILSNLIALISLVVALLK